MNEYMFTVTRSSHCCAIYELAGLSPNVIESGFVEAVREKAKSIGMPKVFPLMIQFSDKDAGSSGNETKGEQLQELLIKEGYKCDRLKLGLNAKSGNKVSLYQWWVHKGSGGKSQVTEYNEEKQQSSGSGLPGRTATARIRPLSTDRRGRRYLRLAGRARTRL